MHTEKEITTMLCWRCIGTKYSTKCTASKCPAWRWNVSPEDVRRHIEWNKNDTNKAKYDKSLLIGRGYCGLAGKDNGHD